MSKTRRIPGIRPALLLCAAAAVLAPVLGAFGEDEEAPFYRAIRSPVVGGRLFMVKGCNTCHAIHGLGGAQGPDLGKARAALTFLDIAGVLWNHQPGMEAEYKRLKLERPWLSSYEMVELITFIYYLGYFGDPGDAAQGELVFRRNRCTECHTVGNHGHENGIPLDRFQSYRSPAFFASALWNGSKAKNEALKQRNLPRPVYEANDLADILAFIRRDANPEERAADIYLPPGNPEKGEDLVETKACLQCHSVAGEGGDMAPALASRRFGGVLSQIGAAMWNHEPGMWESMEAENVPFPQLSPEEFSDLTAYLYFASFVDRPGDPQRGRELFANKGCVKCHGPGQDHDMKGIDVASMDFADAPGIIAAMWNHAPLMDAATRYINVAWPQFQPGEMAHLVAYIESQ